MSEEKIEIRISKILISAARKEGKKGFRQTQ